MWLSVSRLCVPRLTRNLFLPATMATHTTELSQHSKATGRAAEEARVAKEIEIPVPWGHIAVKDWGPECGTPLLGLHGWQDNSGTFDPLLMQQHIPPSWRLLAVDFPGHGLSSHLPAGCSYSYFDFVVSLRRVALHFGWERFGILGHSMGGGIGGLYASFFPEQVERLVMLDTVYPVQADNPDWAKLAAIRIDRMLEVEKKLEGTAPVYEYEDAVQRAAQRLRSHLSEDAMRVLMKRGLRPAEGGLFSYSRDLRLQNIMVPTFSRKLLQDVFSSLRCPLLFLRASERFVPTLQLDDSGMYDLFREVCPYFCLEEVQGHHFMHLDQPEVVGPIVKRFLAVKDFSKSHL